MTNEQSLAQSDRLRRRFRRFVPAWGVQDFCWEWSGHLSPGGYGRITTRTGKHGATGKWQHRGLSAHRFAYIWVNGAIPEGLDLDHICRNRACVNPDHMEPVTRKLNVSRGRGAKRSHCSAGHAYDEANTYFSLKGTQSCRACHRETERNRQQAIRTGRYAPAPRMAERTHCPRGHEYTEENTRRYAGGRRCRACERAKYRQQHPVSVSGGGGT